MRAQALVLPLLVACLAAGALVAPSMAMASRWEVRREVREGAFEVRREKREAAREIRRCDSRACVNREMREGAWEVGRERREARRSVRQEIRENIYDDYYRGDGRWYRDGRYWDRDAYDRYYYYRY
jgi:hypothetical protein